MFEWLNQPLGKSKQKTKELPKKEAHASVVDGKVSKPGSSNSRRIFGMQLGGAKQKTKELPKRETAAPIIERKTPQPAPSDSLRSLLKTAIADAEQIASSIKMRAQEEAEAEAARIIAQAKLEVNEIKGKAELDAQRQAEDIISEAKRKAEIAEAEAKQKVLQFMVRASGQVEKEIKEEYQRTYARLYSSVQGLMNEGQNIEVELKGRVAKLLESQTLELKGLETMLLGTVGASVAPAETESRHEVEEPVEPETESKLEIGKEKTKEDEKKAKKEAQLLAKEEAKAKTEEAKRTKEAQKKAEEQARLITKAEAKDKAEEAKRAKEAQKNAKEEARLVAKVEALEEKVEEAEEPVQTKAETLEKKVDAPVRLEAEVSEKRGPARVDVDSQISFTGEVELLIAPPVELKLVSRLYNYLQTVSELRVLYTRGSWDQGTTIIVVLENPLPLINILLATPDVEVIPELLGREGVAEKSSSLLRGGEQRAKKIKLTLR